MLRVAPPSPFYFCQSFQFPVHPLQGGGVGFQGLHLVLQFLNRSPRFVQGFQPLQSCLQNLALCREVGFVLRLCGFKKRFGGSLPCDSVLLAQVGLQRDHGVRGNAVLS